MKHDPIPATEQLIQQARELLTAESTMVLSVVDTHGQPHATPVFYLLAETSTAPSPASLDLVWLSSPHSLHSACLLTSPRAAAAVHRPTFVWREIAGLQMRGLCSVVEGPARSALIPLYCERFQLGSILSLAIRRSTLYRFRTTWARLLDNRRGFGWKQEFFLSDIS
ncbi:MAG: pyridoxamine 5'-phosphate oxidase family protein [Terracidiphilus sp.]|nr:pyridoxamine 5'-phosphate oxidase family protein [Terracidiphilus sp.]